MIEALYKTEIQQFIKEHENDDPANLMLQASQFPQLPLKEIVLQIQARQKAKAKLPTWYASREVLFPPLIAMEQCSSEITAGYKAEIIKGNKLIDFTGGAAVDTSFFSKSFQQVVYVEKNPQLVALAKHNLKALGIDNVEVIQAHAEDFLRHMTKKADAIYLDPARRGQQNQKVILLTDCEPDVLQMRNELLGKTGQLMIKASPMLDIDLTVSFLEYVHRVEIVAVDNEVKEVLYILHQTKENNPLISAVNLLSSGFRQFFKFTKNTERDQNITYSQPLIYLYEPNKAILKAGAFKNIAAAYVLNKIHVNSHLYTSDHFKPDFPGRTFKVEASANYKKKELMALVPGMKANITVRNFPDSVQQIRKKTGIKEGGDIYLFATTDLNNKLIILVTHKVD